MNKQLLSILVFILSPIICFCIGKEEYKLPPKDIQDLLLASPVPKVLFNNQGTVGVVMESDCRYRPLSDILNAGEKRVAGVRINSHNFSESRYFYNSSNLYLVSTASGQKTAIAGLPADTSIQEVRWSPDGKSFCFVNLTGNESELYRVVVSEAIAVKINTLKLSAIFSPYYQILSDGTVLYKAVPDNIGEFPEEEDPKGPIIQRSKSKKRTYKTYQDLLKCEYDEKVFKYLCTSVFVHWSEKGSSIVSEPEIVRDFSVSPDGSLVLSGCLKPPFSYNDYYGVMPATVHISRTDGTKSLIFPDSLSARKNVQWRGDRDAVLIWTEEKDSLTTVYQTAEPFEPGKGNTVIARTSIKPKKFYWGGENVAVMVQPAEVRTEKAVTAVFDPSNPSQAPRKLKTEGRPYVYAGTRRMFMDGSAFFLYGDDRCDENLDKMGYIDRVEGKDISTSNVWTAKAPYQEGVELIVKASRGRLSFITLRESNKVVPQYFNVEVRKGKVPSRKQITDFANPYPLLENVIDRYVTYTRADGVKLAARLFLPAGYDPAKDGRLPVMMLAYPWEHKTRDSAEKHRVSRYSFEAPAQTMLIHLATQGYAVFQNFSAPIIAKGPSGIPDENYIRHLVMSAEAAVNCLDSIGVADRERIGVCGLSYGAFMTANLMCHTKLFKLGIAMSGAFNRTLTPFGFQHGKHTIWDRPDIYHDMSPFNYADKLSGHLILTHGITDENTGTHPIQSERMYQALAGNGGDVEYIQFPWESHRLRFRESILHLNYEMLNAMNKYLAPAKKDTVAAAPTERWKPIGNRKARVVHWGIIHNHSKGKWDAVRLLGDDYELVGWVDDTNSKAMRMVEPDVKNYEDLPRLTPEQVFNEVKPDLIVIETANSDLVETALEIARHGIPMHMDKPLGVEQSGFRKISDLCKSQGLPLQIGYMFRSNEAICKMVELAKSGALGKIYSVESDMDHNYGYPKYPEYASHYPGGTVYLLSCHTIEWVMPIFDDRIPDKTYSIIKPAPGDPEWAATHSLTIMEYPEANVTIRVCSKGTQPRRHIRIDGTDGSMELEPVEDFTKVKHTTGGAIEKEEIKTLEINLYLRTVNEAAKAAGLHEGVNRLVFEAPTDRYAGQLKELARMIRGEIPYPEDLYQHDLVVHKVSLDACNIKTD